MNKCDSQETNYLNYDPVENYFECISSCNISDFTCVSKCVQILRDEET